MVPHRCLTSLTVINKNHERKHTSHIVLTGQENNKFSCENNHVVGTLILNTNCFNPHYFGTYYHPKTVIILVFATTQNKDLTVNQCGSSVDFT